MTSLSSFFLPFIFPLIYLFLYLFLIIHRTAQIYDIPIEITGYDLKKKNNVPAGRRELSRVSRVHLARCASFALRLHDLIPSGAIIPACPARVNERRVALISPLKWTKNDLVRMESVKLKKSSALSVALRSTADEEDDEGQRASNHRQTKSDEPRTRSQSPAELNMLNKACKSSSSLLLRKRRVKRHMSGISSSHSRSLDRQTLLRHRASPQLQLSDRQWVRQDLRRGSIHVHDRLLAWSHPARPVLCTVDSTAAEIAQRLQQASGKTCSVLRLNAKSYLSTDVNGNCDGEYPLRHLHTGTESLADQPGDRLRLLLLEKDHPYHQQEYDIFTHSEANVDRTSPQDEDSMKRFAGSDVETSSACDDLSSGARFSQHRDSLSDDMILGTDASAFDSSAAEGLDTYGSSSDELELDCPTEPILPEPVTVEAESALVVGADPPALGHSPDSVGTPSDLDSSPALYVQLHGEAARRLGPDERPLQIQNDFLFKLGFKDPWRVQEEGMNTELGSLLRFYAGK